MKEKKPLKSEPAGRGPKSFFADVEYLGVPYAKAKCVHGIWFFRDVRGNYRRFTFQNRVRPVGSPDSEPEQGQQGHLVLGR